MVLLCGNQIVSFLFISAFLFCLAAAVVNGQAISQPVNGTFNGTTCRQGFTLCLSSGRCQPNTQPCGSGKGGDGAYSDDMGGSKGSKGSKGGNGGGSKGSKGSKGGKSSAAVADAFIHRVFGTLTQRSLTSFRSLLRRR